MISNKKCIPCQGGIPPLKNKEINLLMKQLEVDWGVYESKEIRKKFEIRTERSTKNKPTHLSGFLFNT
jgi:hypothetical protein